MAKALTIGRTAFAILLAVGAASCGPGDQRTDLQKLIDFHKAVTGFDHRIEQASAGVDQAVKKGTTDGDLVEMYQAANSFRSSLASISMDISSNLGAPAFQADDLHEHAENVLMDLQGEIVGREQEADSLKQMADGAGAKPSLVAGLQEGANMANKGVSQEVIEIVKSYQELGISADRIDGQNGGLLPPGAAPSK